MIRACATCEYWQVGQSQGAGQCRAMAPSAGDVRWPQTTAGDWCGMFLVRQPSDTPHARILRRLQGDDLPQQFTARDVQRKGWKGLTDNKVVTDTLETLVAVGVLTCEVITTEGRPKKLYSGRRAA